MISHLLIGLLLHQGSTLSGICFSGGKPVRDAVVFLEGNEKGEPIKRAAIIQKDKTFIPHVLVVTKGTKVDFPNGDSIFHNVFAHASAQRFDVGMYPKGQTRSVVFDKPGLISVLCNIHPDMSAFIYVVDTPYYAKTDSRGQFTIAKVKAGSYELRVWHESGKTASMEWTASGPKQEVRLDLRKG